MRERDALAAVVELRGRVYTLAMYLLGDSEEAQDGTTAVLVRTHLDRCADCRDDWLRAVAVRDGLRTMPTFEPPQSVCDRVRAAAEGFGRGSWSLPSASARRWLALAACAAAMVLAMVALGPRRGVPPAGQEVSVSNSQAAAEAKFAVALIADVGRRAQVRVERELLDSGSLETTARGVSLSLRWLRRATTTVLGPRAGLQREQQGGV